MPISPRRESEPLQPNSILSNVGIAKSTKSTRLGPSRCEPCRHKRGTARDEAIPSTWWPLPGNTAIGSRGSLDRARTRGRSPYYNTQLVCNFGWTHLPDRSYIRISRVVIRRSDTYVPMCMFANCGYPYNRTQISCSSKRLSADRNGTLFLRIRQNP